MSNWYDVFLKRPLRDGPFLVMIEISGNTHWVTSAKYDYPTDTWYYSPNGAEYNLVCNPTHWAYIP